MNLNSVVCIYNQAKFENIGLVRVAQVTLFYIQDDSRSILSILRPWVGWGEPSVEYYYYCITRSI